MASETKVETKTEKKLDKKTEKKTEKKGIFSRLVRYCKETVGEVKKLTWLTKKELLSRTAAVIVFVVAMSILIYALDFIFGTGMNLIG